jgi:Ca-activated chloride channel family protein
MTVHIAPLPDEVPSLPDAGLGALTTGRGNLPLDSVDVHASVTGLAAGIEVTQGFRNPFGVPLEATYVFPLPDRAAVTAMRMEAADRVIESTLKERGQARQDYDTAIAAGQRAAIAEEDRPDIFTMRVGNILPGERVTVRLTLSQPLPYEDGAATFRFPLVVAPRYIPGRPLDDLAAGDGVEPDTDAVPDASRISPPVLLPGFPDPVRLSLTVDLDPAGLPLSELRSSLHVVATETAADRTILRLQPGERLDRDFILRLGFAPRESSSLALVPDSSGLEGTFTLTVLPGGTAAPRPRDVVLVIDRSGSMMGWKMVAARRSAARIVDTLTDRDRFAVLCFDDRIEEPDGLPVGLSSATDRHRFRAVEHLAKLEARGGTEMLAPLEQAARLLSGKSELSGKSALSGESGRDRVLVLITDGQVGNEDQILARLAPALEKVRVHAVGIDQAVNAGFLHRLAGIGKGRFELVESEDRLDEAMDHIHQRIGSPLATELSLAAEGLSLVSGTVSPGRLGALFPGVPLAIAGRFTGDATGSLAVRGVAADGSAWEQRAEGTVVDDPASAAIWARGHLRDLEDAYVVAGSDELEKRIVSISLRFNVLCRFTAFVAVDNRVVTSGDAPHQVIQPVEQPRGWQYGAAPAAANPAYARPMSAPAPSGPAQWAAGTPAPPFAPQSPAPFAGPPAPSAPGGLPRGHGRSFVRGRMPFPDAPVPPPVDELAEVRRQAADEVALLAGCAHDPEHVRWELLSDLRTRLEGLISRLRTLGTDVPGLDALVALHAELAVADDRARRSDLAGLWERTVRVLTEFSTGSVGPSAGGPASPPRAFWKRRP